MAPYRSLLSAVFSLHLGTGCLFFSAVYPARTLDAEVPGPGDERPSEISPSPDDPAKETPPVDSPETRCAGLTASNYAALGAGTDADPYVLCNARQLSLLSVSQAAWSASFVLGSDVDLAGLPWTPVGSSSAPFRGRFDGRGHVVSNVNIEAGGDGVGLFGVVGGSAATLKSLRVHKGRIEGRDFVGILAGELRDGSSVIDCEATGSARGRVQVGGLIGRALLGVAVSVSRSYAAVSGDHTVGGFIGAAREGTMVFDSFARGDVTGTAVVGGFVGDAQRATFITSYASGTVSSGGVAAGFVASSQAGFFDRCFAIGDVLGVGDPVDSGRFIGIGDGPGALERCASYSGSVCTVSSSACGPAGPGETSDAERAHFAVPGSGPLSLWDFANAWVMDDAAQLPAIEAQIVDSVNCAEHVNDTPFAGGRGTMLRS
jgi:hypothetical protein